MPLPSSASAPGEGRIGDEGAGGAGLGVDDRKPVAGAAERGERIVAAGIQHEDARPRRQSAERVEHVVQPHALQRNVGLALGIEIHGNEIVLAVDLQAVAGIEHQGDRIGAAGTDLAGEVRDRRPHLVLRQIGGGRDGKAGVAEQLRHALGVVGGVGQLRHRPIGGLADHQREPRFGRGIGRNHQLREREKTGSKQKVG